MNRDDWFYEIKVLIDLILAGLRDSRVVGAFVVAGMTLMGVGGVAIGVLALIVILTKS